MAELKPCPFCGGTAIRVENIEPRLHRPVRNHPYAVVCWECDLYFGYDEDYGGRFDTENEAIKAWNRRAERREDPEEQTRVYYCENERYEIPERREDD